MQSKLRDIKKNKSMGSWGHTCGMDYSNWSFLLLVGMGRLLFEGWWDLHTGHIEAGEMDIPELRNS